MTKSYQEAERQLNDVLSAAMALSPIGDFQEARDYLDHGDYGLALDTIAAALVEGGKRADAALYAKFVELGRQMDFEESNWASLRPAT